MLYGVKMCDEQISTKDIKASIFTPTMMINLVSVMCDTHIMNATSRALMEGINMEKSSQGCYEAMQLSQ